jgi:predicted dehydrogenase
LRCREQIGNERTTRVESNAKTVAQLAGEDITMQLPRMNHNVLLSRRTFLKGTAGAATIISASALGRDRPAPSERINVGLIGFGARGQQVLGEFLKQADAQVVAVCDVQRLHYRELEWGKGPALGREAGKRVVETHYAANKTNGTYSGCLALSDYRELCGRSDIDAVIVASPDHWHALQALEALRQRKDVYCEKPMTHFFAEGLALCREATERKAVVQVGSQQRSQAVFRQAVEAVRGGRVGTIQRVEVGLPAGYETAKGDATDTEPPAELDYEMWCGPAPKLAYMRARHHRWWRGNRAFGGGTLMDWIGHHNDIAHWAIDADRGGPLRVEAVDWTRPRTDIYDTPVDFTIRCEYPGGIELVISSKFDLGTKWIGNGGWLYVNRGKLQASDERWLKSLADAGAWKGDIPTAHVRNFLDCIKSRGQCIAPPETAHRSITPGHLGYVSNQLGRAVRWDAKAQQIIGDDEARRLLLTMSHRAPWKLA